MKYDQGHKELKEEMEKRNQEVAKHRDYKQKLEDDMKEIQSKEQ